MRTAVAALALLLAAGAWGRKSGYGTDYPERYIASDGGEIRLLPALPANEVEQGHVSGLTAAGGFLFDLEWRAGQVTKLRVFSKDGGVCRIRSTGEIRSPILRTRASDGASAPFGYEFDTSPGEVVELHGAVGQADWPRAARAFPDRLLKTAEAARIAANVLAAQLDVGGWPAHLPLNAKFSPRDRAALVAVKGDAARATVDDGATVTELDFLARLYAATGLEPARAAVRRGLDFLLTLPPDVIVRPTVRPTLALVACAQPPFDFPLPPETRAAARLAAGDGAEELAARAARAPYRDEVPTDEPLVRRVDGGASLQAVIDSLPVDSPRRTVVRVAPGRYREKVKVGANLRNVCFVADDPRPEKTVISWNDTPATPRPDGKGTLGTFGSCTLRVEGSDISFDGFTIENTGTPERLAATGGREQAGQCVALFACGDRCAFRNCRILGWQDTVYAGGTVGATAARQYFGNCYIEGAVDFIFGNAVALFDTCELHSHQGGYVTAGSHEPELPFGYVFVNCRVTCGGGKQTLLGRPWRPYANVAFVGCDFGTAVLPAGWRDWTTDCGRRVYRSAEYGCTHDGAFSRAPWIAVGTLDDFRARLSAAGMATAADILAGPDGWRPMDAAR